MNLEGLFDTLYTYNIKIMIITFLNELYYFLNWTFQDLRVQFDWYVWSIGISLELSVSHCASTLYNTYSSSREFIKFDNAYFRFSISSKQVFISFSCN